MKDLGEMIELVINYLPKKNSHNSAKTLGLGVCHILSTGSYTFF